MLPVLETVAITQIITQAIKFTVGRQRPYTHFGDPQAPHLRIAADKHYAPRHGADPGARWRRGRRSVLKRHAPIWIPTISRNCS